jgi:hypothetical protein
MSAPRHTMPRKINIVPPLILGLSGGQSFTFVLSLFLFIGIAATFNGIIHNLIAFLVAIILLVVEYTLFRVINGGRRALIPHHCKRWWSMCFNPRRFSGRGQKTAWERNKK